MMFPRAVRLFESLALLEVFLSEDFNVDTFLNKLKSVVTLARRGATEGERSASRGALERLMSRAKDEAKAMSSGDATRFLAQMRAIADGVNATTEPPAEPRRRPRPEPPKSELLRFKVGTWVCSTQTGRVGRIQALDHSFPCYVITSPTVTAQQHIWQAVDSNLRRATQEEVDAALATRSKPKPEPEAKAKAKAKPEPEPGPRAGSGSSTADWKIIRFATYQEGTSDKVYGVATTGGGKCCVFWGARKGPYTAKDYTGDMNGALAQYRTKIRKGYEDYDDHGMRVPPSVLDLLRAARNLP